MNQGWTYRDRIKPTEVGLSVLEFYSQHYRHSSRAEWQTRIEAGQIELEGRVAQANEPLQPGQSLAYHRLPWLEPEVPLHFEVLFEDGDLLIINKPAGLPVLPGGNFLTHTLLHQLSQHYPDHPPVPVHRLGRGTSGLMVLARSPLARSILSRQFRESTAAVADPQATHSICKTYLALVGPGDLPDRFTVTTPIGKIPHPVLGYIYAASAQGRPAHSEVEVQRRLPDSTLVAVTIRTGRPHQIRIHLAAAGYPLLGDPLYGGGGVPICPEVANDGDMPVPGDLGYHLHAYRLHFPHPRHHQPLAFVCPPPASLGESQSVHP